MKVAWSIAEKDRFLTHSNNMINLYQAFPYDERGLPKGCIHLSENFYASNRSTLSDVPLIKCVVWYPGNTVDSLIAVGQANGKVHLSNFSQKTSSDLVGKEFIPKPMRHCTYLAWNPVHTQLLAQGLDKHKNECCICIWDVTTATGSDLPPNPYERPRYSSNMADTAITKPYLEIGMGETTSSFAWFAKESKTFVTGMNGKCLRVYDIRDASKPHLVTHTRAVNGVCTDPQQSHRVASYFENTVSIWDVRSFEKPILTLPSDKGVIQIDWCPTRVGVLGSLCRDSSVVKLYDIRHSIIGTDELEPVLFESVAHPIKQDLVMSFAWHPTCENRIMFVTPSGGLIDSQLFEKLPLSLSPSMNLSWVFGRKVNTADFGSELDMAARIQQRALQGYGLHKDEPWNNAVVARDETYLHALWHWLDLCKSSSGYEDKRTKHLRYSGVIGLLERDGPDTVTESCYNFWLYPEGARSNSREAARMLQYNSAARSRALQLCGWRYDRDNRDAIDPLTDLLDSMVKSGMEPLIYERAAAIALFNLRIGKAVEILSSAPAQEENSFLTTAAMALSGFTEDRNAMWRRTCNNLRQTLKQPYLRAMFAFLACDKDSYEEVLKEEPCMAVKDRVGFACLYLRDTKLAEYLHDLCKQLSQAGNLDGILLTGLTNEAGLELLGNYVDLTSDVQTAALAIIYSSPSELTNNELCKTWIESYRYLLDRWQLWHQRAKFDILRHSLDKSRVVGQAFVSCNYCGKSVANNVTLAARSRSSNFSMLPPTNKPKITCCPGCRKPLPRCALCLTNLGTPSGSVAYQQKEKSEFETKLSPFDNWFTWCQQCRHGGHASHVTDWFRDHPECPVTGCQCKCMTIDPVSQLTAYS